jgi:lipoprotein-anchoring transpeptidase ErfK/SrfK
MVIGASLLRDGEQAAAPTTSVATTTTSRPTTTAPPTTPPTTAAPTTTTAPVPQPRLKNPVHTIAKIKNEFVLVSRTLPADAETAVRQELDPGGQPPRSNPEKTTPLPNPDFQIQGRFTYGDGWKLDNPGPFGEHLSLLVTARQGDWLEVELPVRPNGTRGWIHSSTADLVTSQIHFEVILAEHRLLAWDGNTLLADTPVAIGTPDTKTPTGRHFITDQVEQPGGSKYGPWIFGTNAFSEDMNTFDGGAPQIALHGWNNESAFGRSVSNGCVRLPNEVIERLSVAPLGTIVDIWPA